MMLKVKIAGTRFNYVAPQELLFIRFKPINGIESRNPLVRPFWLKMALLPMQGENSITDVHTILNMLTEASLQTRTPRNAYEALKSPQKHLWLAAMNREKECHLKNGIPLDNTSKAIPADWVFKIKYRGGPIHVDKLVDKQFKARVVIRGQFMRGT
jgi:hypothetical protein